MCTVDVNICLKMHTKMWRVMGFATEHIWELASTGVAHERSKINKINEYAKTVFAYCLPVYTVSMY